MRLREKMAVVTGSAAGTGIGKAIAHRFASEGAFVIMTVWQGDRSAGVPPAMRAPYSLPGAGSGPRSRRFHGLRLGRADAELEPQRAAGIVGGLAALQK